eukprot:5235579-Amphidinium_carterae.4
MPSSSRASRRKVRWKQQRDWKLRVNMIIGVHTWLALGKPRPTRLAGVLCLPLSDIQSMLIKRMESHMIEFDRLTGAGASDSCGLSTMSTSLVERLGALAESRHEYMHWCEF